MLSENVLLTELVEKILSLSAKQLVSAIEVARV